MLICTKVRRHNEKCVWSDKTSIEEAESVLAEQGYEVIYSRRIKPEDLIFRLW